MVLFIVIFKTYFDLSTSKNLFFAADLYLIMALVLVRLLAKRRVRIPSRHIPSLRRTFLRGSVQVREIKFTN